MTEPSSELICVTKVRIRKRYNVLSNIAYHKRLIKREHNDEFDGQEFC